MTVVIARLAAVTATLLLLAGCSSQDWPTASSEPASTAGQTIGEEWEEPELRDDCFGQELPGKEQMGPPRDHFVSREGLLSCGYRTANLQVIMFDVGGDDKVVRINVDPELEAPQPAREVTISNMMLWPYGSETVFPVADHLEPLEPTWWEEHLDDSEAAFDDAVESHGGLWKRAFGGPPAFDDVFQQFDPDGNTFRIAPVFTAAECPECAAAPHDLSRELWFSLDSSTALGGSINAVQFDLTVDGETRTIAYWTPV